MTTYDEMDRVGWAFSVALGHLRNATVALLGAADQSSESLLWGIAGLELQGLFGDVWPACLDDDLTAAESLAAAEQVLGEVVDEVPLAIWVGLRSLREQVGDGHR